MRLCKFAASVVTAIAVPGFSFADCDLDIDQLEDLVGYEVEGVYSVAGWVDEAAGKVGNEDDWEGCRYNRKIIFSDGTTVKCTSHHNSSAWGQQKAVMFERHSSKMLCIDDQLIDVR